MRRGDGQLVCLPLFLQHGEELRYGLSYHDYEKDVANREAWHHISCTVNSQKQLLVGTLLRQNFDGSQHEFAYIKETKDFPDKFLMSQDRSWDKFEVQLNGDINKRNGMENIYFADVRVWKEARSWHQIQHNR